VIITAGPLLVRYVWISVALSGEDTDIKDSIKIIIVGMILKIFNIVYSLQK